MPDTANPAPLGLMGFGMTTVLLNIHNAGFFPQGAMIIGMGIFYGGLAQLAAGVFEFFKGNTFGLTAFFSYGAFWESLVVIFVAKPIFDLDAPPRVFVGWYLFMWGLFTTYMTLGTIRKNIALFNIFASLSILFYLLAIAHWLPENAGETATKIAGWEGIYTGFSAIYLAMAEILNDSWKVHVLPVGRSPTEYLFDYIGKRRRALRAKSRADADAEAGRRRNDVDASIELGEAGGLQGEVRIDVPSVHDRRRSAPRGETCVSSSASSLGSSDGDSG